MCFIVSLWWSLRHGVHISGHDFIEETTNACGCVLVLRCNRCGSRSIGWT